MAKQEIVLFETDQALVTKFSEAWTVENNDNINFDNHPVYKNLIGQQADSMQVSFGGKIYKAGGPHGSFGDVKFGTAGKVRIIFEPNEEKEEEKKGKFM